MARPSPSSPDSPAARRRPSARRWARFVQAVVVVGILGTAGARAMAAPVGPIDVAGHGAGSPLAAARLGYGIDAQGRIGHVTVQRPADAPDQAVMVELTAEGGTRLATQPAVLQGPAATVVLSTPVDPARVHGAALRPA